MRFFIFTICISSLFAKNIQIIAPFCPLMEPGGLQRVIKNHSTICSCPYHTDFKTLSIDFNQNDAYLFFDLNMNSLLEKKHREKSILINMEPRFYSLEYFKNFETVLTWNDDLIDNKKFFKLHYPNLEPMLENLPSFEEKKFACMITSNWVSHRIMALDYFYQHPEYLDVYSQNIPQKYRLSPMNKGVIEGSHSSDEKFQVLKKYKFNLCFENTIGAKGYITEKIFHSFKSGCVPVYIGASNITDYIPSNCFVDLRTFKSFDELVSFLLSMTKETYNSYLENIRKFLACQNAQSFTYKNFEDTINEAINKIEN
jgi:hypothetical protein